MQQEAIFILKHKDHDVAVLRMDMNGEFHDVFIIDNTRMPYLGLDNGIHIKEWWDNRAIPEGRARLEELFEKYGCTSTSQLLMKNLALSLTDCYWLCPADEKLENALTWEEVNLFKHGNNTLHFYSPATGIHYSNYKDVSLGGHLDKEARFIGGKWYLEKKGDFGIPFGLQNINEAFASEFHRLQGFHEFIPYDVIAIEREKAAMCRCLFFTNEHLEYQTAYEITGGCSLSKEKNTKRDYENLIATCVHGGLNERYVRHFLDYMILSDFVLSNDDRHWTNFGILRNPDTLEFIAMAPLYDTGNSMFHKEENIISRERLVRITDSGIGGSEIERLLLVSDRLVIDASKIPTPKFVMEFYESYGVSHERATNISKSYSNKVDLFLEFQHGLPISVAREAEFEWHRAFENQKLIPEYFQIHNDEATPQIKKALARLEAENTPIIKFGQVSSEEIKTNNAKTNPLYDTQTGHDTI